MHVTLTILFTRLIMCSLYFHITAIFVNSYTTIVGNNKN